VAFGKKVLESVFGKIFVLEKREWKCPQISPMRADFFQTKSAKNPRQHLRFIHVHLRLLFFSREACSRASQRGQPDAKILFATIWLYRCYLSLSS